jgi:uncharacterized protein (TIGR02001 family)
VGSGRAALSWVVTAVALIAAGAAHAQDAVSGVSGYLTLGSGHWKHGLSQSDGPSLQLGVDYQHYTGFFAYARALNVDYPQNLPNERRDVETSAYVGYHERGDRWSWTVSLGRYVYPDSDGYDYGEWSGSVGYRDRVFYTASYSDEYYARGGPALNQEVSVAFPLPANFEIGGAVGYFDIGGGPEIAHWNVGASKLVGRMAVDLRYYDGNYGYRNYLGDPSAEHVVLSLSYVVKRRQFRGTR